MYSSSFGVECRKTVEITAEQRDTMRAIRGGRPSNAGLCRSMRSKKWGSNPPRLHQTKPREFQDSRGFFLVVSGDGRGSWQASLARLAGQRCFGGAAERIRTLWRRLPTGPDYRAGASRNAAAERSGVRTGPPQPVGTLQPPTSGQCCFNASPPRPYAVQSTPGLGSFDECSMLVHSSRPVARSPHAQPRIPDYLLGCRADTWRGSDRSGMRWTWPISLIRPASPPVA